MYANRQKLYRFKRKSIENFQGNVREQYSKLRQYCHEILKANPGSTAILKTQGASTVQKSQISKDFCIDEQQRGFSYK